MNARLSPALLSSSVVIAAIVSLLCSTSVTQDTDWRTIEFETTEVTAPRVAISPDGQWLIFTVLGHLFRPPVEGGEAVQLNGSARAVVTASDCCLLRTQSPVCVHQRWLRRS